MSKPAPSPFSPLNNNDEHQDADERPVPLGQYVPATQYVAAAQYAPAVQYVAVAQYAPAAEYASADQYVPIAQYVPDDQYAPAAQYVPTGQRVTAMEPGDRFAPPSYPPAEAAIDMTHSRLWVPLYVTVLVALVVNIVLMGISMAIDMINAPLVSPGWDALVGYLTVADACTGGCAAVNTTAISDRFAELGKDGGSYGWDREGFSVLAQSAPYNVTWCDDTVVNKTSFRMASLNGNATASFTVNCAYNMTYALYSGDYVIGPAFYHARGAPRIHRTSQYLAAQTPIMYALLFAFGGLSLVLYIAAFALRAQMRGRRSGCDDDDDDYERGCACDAPHHVRRLLAAVIAFVVVNVVITVVQFAVCGVGSVPDPDNEGHYIHFTTLGGYYGILAVILVVELCALVCACVMYGARV